MASVGESILVMPLPERLTRLDVLGGWGVGEAGGDLDWVVGYRIQLTVWWGNPSL
jgi:hypothetical protein